MVEEVRTTIVDLQVTELGSNGILWPAKKKQKKEPKLEEELEWKQMKNTKESSYFDLCHANFRAYKSWMSWLEGEGKSSFTIVRLRPRELDLNPQ